MYIKAQEEAEGTSKKHVGPCILSPRGGYLRDIEGPCFSTRESYVGAVTPRIYLELFSIIYDLMMCLCCVICDLIDDWMTW